MSSRIQYLNRSTYAAGLNKIQGAINHFISQEGALDLRYQIYFVEGNQSISTQAIIKVYRENPDDPSGEWDFMGRYNATEWKKFSADLDRATNENPTGALELANNLLYNGLFNAIGDPIDGWSIQTDGTSGTAYIKGIGDRIVIGSDGSGSVIIRNTKTELENLVTYSISIRVHAIGSTSNFSLQIGGQSGNAYSSTGVYNESIISGGVEFDINVNIGAGEEVIIDYIIVNDN